MIESGAKVGVTETEDNKYASKYCTHGIVLVEGGATVLANSDIPKGSMIEQE